MDETNVFEMADEVIALLEKTGPQPNTTLEAALNKMRKVRQLLDRVADEKAQEQTKAAAENPQTAQGEDAPDQPDSDKMGGAGTVNPPPAEVDADQNKDS